MPEELLKHFQKIKKEGNCLWAEFNHSPLLMAKAFKKIGGRLISLSPYLGPDGQEITIYYHFAYQNEVFNIKLQTKKQQIDSITSIYPNADWLEKEAGEMYGIKFIGHQNQTNLLLTAQNKTPLLAIEKEKIGIK